MEKIEDERTQAHKTISNGEHNETWRAHAHQQIDDEFDLRKAKVMFEGNEPLIDGQETKLQGHKVLRSVSGTSVVSLFQTENAESTVVRLEHFGDKNEHAVACDTEVCRIANGVELKLMGRSANWDMLL